MSRRKTTTRRLLRPARSLAFAAAALSALFCLACAGPERPLLEQFFSASRLRDRTALQTIATVIFEPRERGIVRRFDVVRVDARTENGRARRYVTISAPVALPDGRNVRKTMVVATERDGSGRWIVTAVDDSESRR